MPIRLVLEHDRPREDTSFAAGYVTAALDTPERREGAPAAPLAGERFHAVIAVEGVWTGDGRFWEPGAFTWRDLPLPLMATDKATHGPGDTPPSITVGAFDRIERIGAEIHGWGAYVDSTDAEVQRLQDLVHTGFLRGISLDGDDPEYEVIIPAEMMQEPTTDDEGNLVMSGAFPRQVFSHTRIMGATAMQFPAIAEAFIEDDTAEPAIDPAAADPGFALAASLIATAPAESNLTGWLTAAAPAVLDDPPFPIEAPLIPPVEFFDELHLEGPTPLTITAAGEVIGHLALWGTCHIGSREGECITPPRSAAAYAHFLLGEIVVSDGSRVSVGKITMNAGHAPIQLMSSAHRWWEDSADLALTASAAAAHYDNTASVAAHVTCGEDEFGIWLHGSLMPGLSPVAIRALMGSDLSGDWRRIDGNLELVAMLAVNVPGFPKPGTKAQRRNTARCRVRSHQGQVASLIACLPVSGDEPYTRLSAEEHQAVVDRIASTIGRARHQRIAALVNRVHGGS